MPDLGAGFCEHGAECSSSIRQHLQQTRHILMLAVEQQATAQFVTAAPPLRSSTPSLHRSYCFSQTKRSAKEIKVHVTFYHKDEEFNGTDLQSRGPGTAATVAMR
jgi:hypothetical protein